MDPLSLTVSIATLIGTTTQVFSYLNDVRTATKERAKLASETANLLALLTNLRNKAEESEQTKDKWYGSTRALLGGSNGPLDQFRHALEVLAENLAPATSLKKIGRSLTWTLGKKECLEILAKIERLKSLIGLALQEDVLKLAEAIQSDTALIPALGGSMTEITKRVEGIQLRDDVKLRQTIIQWLSPLNFFVTQNDIISRRQEGTGQWLLESSEFRDWLSCSGKTLWCPGIPGAGKTILASIVVDQLHKQFKDENSIGIACMYCNYKENETQTPVNLVAGLWRQLVQDHRPLSDDARDLHNCHANRGTRPTLSEVLKLLQSEISRHSKVFVVVDALDECTEGGLLLTELRALRPTVKLLVTSRFLDDIASEFKEAAQLEISASSEDVQMYVVGRISSENRLSRYVSKDPTLGDDIVKTVVGNAQKMFLLAQLHMDSLATKGTPKAVRKALKSLPEELDGTYEEAMRRIESQNVDDKQLAERVLFWISFALRPLTLNELQHALAVEPGESELDEENIPDGEHLTSLCAGLVIVDPQSNVIRLIHYTTQEYFERIRLNRFPTAQTEIATTCLTYLLFDVFSEGCCSTNTDFKIRLQKNCLLDYAAKHWADHTRGDPEKIIQELVLEFLEESSKLSCAMQVVLVDDPMFSAISAEIVTGLQVVAYFGLYEISRKLLDLKVDVATKNAFETAALPWAAVNGHEAVVSLLIEKGADVSSRNSNGITALHWAASNGHEVVVSLLIEKGADVLSRDALGETALHWAAATGHEAVVSLLIEKGADVLSRDALGETALYWAAENGHDAVVSLLIEKGADVPSRGSNGMPVLQ